MRKTNLITSLASVGLMVLVVSAKADTTYNLTVPNVVAGGGSYHVVLDESSIFKWHISSVRADSGANTPVSDANVVRLVFYTGVNATGSVITNVSATGTGGTDGARSNWGAATLFAAGTYQYSTNNAANKVNLNGSNDFAQSALGNYILGSPNAKSFTIQVIGNLPGDFGVYYKTFNVSDFSTPEASSLAMLLPGLVPLGVALRRRRASRS